MKTLKVERPPSFFLCTDEGENYIKRLCDRDDVKNHVEVPLPPIPKYTRSRIKLYSVSLHAFLKQIMP